MSFFSKRVYVPWDFKIHRLHVSLFQRIEMFLFLSVPYLTSTSYKNCISFRRQLNVNIFFFFCSSPVHIRLLALLTVDPLTLHMDRVYACVLTEFRFILSNWKWLNGDRDGKKVCFHFYFFLCWWWKDRNETGRSEERKTSGKSYRIFRKTHKLQ